MPRILGRDDAIVPTGDPWDDLEINDSWVSESSPPDEATLVPGAGGLAYSSVGYRFPSSTSSGSSMEAQPEPSLPVVRRSASARTTARAAARQRAADSIKAGDGRVSSGSDSGDVRRGNPFVLPPISQQLQLELQSACERSLGEVSDPTLRELVYVTRHGDTQSIHREPDDVFQTYYQGLRVSVSVFVAAEMESRVEFISLHGGSKAASIAKCLAPPPILPTTLPYVLPSPKSGEPMDLLIEQIESEEKLVFSEAQLSNLQHEEAKDRWTPKTAGCQRPLEAKDRWKPKTAGG